VLLSHDRYSDREWIYNFLGNKIVDKIWKKQNNTLDLIQVALPNLAIVDFNEHIFDEIFENSVELFT